MALRASMQRRRCRRLRPMARGMYARRLSPDLKVIKKTGGDHETRFAMTSKSWISRVAAPLIALALAVAPSGSPVHAVEDARKVSVLSFGLFGDQGVFRREATGAAQVVVGRFGSGPINVQYNSKKGGGATIEGLAMSLQAAADGMDADNDILFLILTSHGSRAGLAVKAGRLSQTLTPSDLADMLARTGMRYKVVVISACYSGSLHPSSREPRYAGNHGGRCRPSVVRLPGQSQVDLFRQRLFQCRTPAS